jgi:phosphatidate phosphatase APP1
VSTRPFIAARIEEFFDRRAEAFFRALGWQEYVLCYTGYGTTEHARVLGRVVLIPRRAQTQLGRATETFVKRRGWRNFFTAACVRAQVTITMGDQSLTVTTDRGGYIDQRVPGHHLPAGWQHATLATASSAPSEASIQIVGDEVRFGLISDVDDTVLTTWLPRPMIAAWNTFFRDELNRAAVPGMARLYQELLDAHPGAPLLYLSTGAWNTHDFLNRFLRRHRYPLGAFLLTDWGPTNTGWFRSGREHKLNQLMQLARDFPGIAWVLIGDDGQHDPEIYAEFAAARPDHVRVVAIRQLSPAEQVLAHGTPTAMVEPPEEPVFDAPVIEAPDGRGLAAQLRPLLGLGG